MNHIKYRPNNSVNKIRTTIGVKLWTKNLVLKHSNPGESFDDTIVRIFKSFDRQNEMIERLEMILENNEIKEPNFITESYQERLNDVIVTEEGINIFFNYNKPTERFPEIESYDMDVVLFKANRNGRKIGFDKIGFTEVDWIWLRFKIVEKIINNHFDPSFQLPLKSTIADPRYWKTVCSRVGLSNSSFEKDILTIISDYERGGGIDENSTANLHGPA